MLKKIFIALFIFICNINFAQDQKATLYYRDGGNISGYAKIMHTGEIKFKKNRSSQKEFYNSVSIYKVIILIDGVDTELVYKYVDGENTPKLLEPLVKGTVSLFQENKIVYTQQMSNGGGSMPIGSVNSLISYYVCRNNIDEVIHLGSKGMFSKNFKKAASNYFKDCPRLIKKIKSKEYKKKDIVEIVQVYNFLCGKIFL